MIRKTLLALAATVAVGAAVMTPTTASAWHFHGHGFYGYGWRVAPVVVAPVIASCHRYRWIETRRGLRRVLVNVCAY